jgi:POT family proton-dependent oligopeptide transporter
VPSRRTPLRSARRTTRATPAPTADSRFFYLGINLGGFLGPLITGLLQTHAGFRYGFGAAAVGMALDLGQYVVFRRNLGTRGREVPNSLPHNRIALYAGVAVLDAVAIAVGLVVLGLASWISRLMEGVH